MTTRQNTPRNGPVAACYSVSDPVQLLRDMKRGKTWRRLEKELGVNFATLRAVAAGVRKPSDAIYRALNITPPVRVVELQPGYDVAKVCPSCGVVHTTKRCAAKRKRATPQRVRWAQWMYPGDF